MMQLSCPCSKKKASPKDSAINKEMKDFSLFAFLRKLIKFLTFINEIFS